MNFAQRKQLRVSKGLGQAYMYPNKEQGYSDGSSTPQLGDAYDDYVNQMYPNPTVTTTTAPAPAAAPTSFWSKLTNVVSKVTSAVKQAAPVVQQTEALVNQAKAATSTQSAAQTYIDNGGAPPPVTGMSTTTKVLIGTGVAAGLGIGGYFLLGGKKKKKLSGVEDTGIAGVKKSHKAKKKKK